MKSRHAGDGFGDSVTLSADGSTLAVGAPFETSAAIGIGGNQADNSASGAGVLRRGRERGFERGHTASELVPENGSR